jgi:hypothetical protein
MDYITASVIARSDLGCDQPDLQIRLTRHRIYHLYHKRSLYLACQLRDDHRAGMSKEDSDQAVSEDLPICCVKKRDLLISFRQ